MSRIVCGFIAAWVGISGTARGVELTASVDRNVITLDDRVVLSVSLSGAGQGSAPVLPPLEGFRIDGPARTAHQIQFVNFQTFIGAQYEYTLVPLKPGRFVIGPVTLNYQNTEYKTPPITIEVLDRGNAAPPPAPPRTADDGAEQPPARAGGAQPERMFVELSADKTDVWLREQVIVTFRFYYYADAGLAEQPVYEAPPADGFVEKHLGDGKSVNYAKVMNGRRYQVIELKSALYPYKTGELTVGPAKLKGSVLTEAPRRAGAPRGIFDMEDIFNDPFFGHYAKQPFTLVSNKVAINVRPLPKEGAPSGEVSVGRYRLSVEAKPQKVHAGDPVTLTMTVSGEGDLDRVVPPRVSSLGGFKAYDPTATTPAGDTGVRKFEQAIVPLDEKIKEIPQVVFNYFDPATGKYVTLKEGPFPLKVLPPQADRGGKIVSLPSGAEGRDVKLLERNIVFIKTAPGALERDAGTGKPGTLFWLLQIIPVGAVAAAFVHARHRARLTTDQGYARLYRAGSATRARLKSVEGALRGGKTGEFYGGVARAVSAYVADRLNIPAGGLTPELVREHLSAKGATPELLRRLEGFYRTCDLARFAPSGGAGKEMSQCHREATEILEELRRAKW